MYYNIYLAHHGVKGQKWGVKNGVFISNGASKMSEELTDNFRAYDVNTGKRVECTMHDL